MPEAPELGTRKVPFSRVVYIEQDDFREDPPKKFFRLAPGREVRLKYAYCITCTSVVERSETQEKLSKCTANTMHSREAARPQTAGRLKARCIGFLRSMQ